MMRLAPVKRIFPSAARLLLTLAAVLLPVYAFGETAPFSIQVTSHPITRFRIGADETRFGPLEFIGGLELRSRARQFGSISGFRHMPGTDEFVAVTDTGYWMFGRISRHEDGRPAGFADVAMQAILDADGKAGVEKSKVDAESLHLDGSSAIVGFEHDHRIALYQISGKGASAEKGRIDFPIPRNELRRNAGFEALARAPEQSHLAGALLVMTERSLDADGNIFAAILEGPGKGVFKVARIGSFAVTDSVFLPSGDLLLLERSFNYTEGVRMRLRLLPLAEIAPGRIVQGEILLETDMRHQIDNMEAMDAWVDADGFVRLSVLSDDNQSFLQRNLYLEFRFAERLSSGRNIENTSP